MRSPDERFELPPAMDEKLRRVRGRLSLVGVVTAMVIGVAVLLGAMLLAMLVDYLATLYDSSWRRVLTYSAWAAAGLVLCGWAGLAVRRWRRLTNVAREVDRRAPQLEERWAIVTEHAKAAEAAGGGAHPAVLRRVAEEANRRGAGVAPGEVASLDGLVRAFLAVNAATVVLVLAAVLDWRQTNVLVRRFWAPEANISATTLDARPGDVVVGRGEPLTLAASLGGAPVETTRLAILRGGDQQSVTLVPRRVSDAAPLTATHRLRKVEESFRYRFRAGDGQTDWSEVTVADRPTIEAARMRLTPPDYRQEKPKTFNKMPRRVAIVEGTEVELAVKPRGEVASLRLSMGGEFFQILSPDADGWYRWRGTPSRTLRLSPIATEPHGLENRRPPVTQLRVYPDRPPVVRVLTPDDQIAVTPDDTVEISFVAQDDNGVGAAELVVYQQPGDPIEQVMGDEQVVLERIPITIEGEGRKRVRGRVSLDLTKYALEDGASISYEVRVTEQRSPLRETRATTALGAVKGQGRRGADRPAASQPTAHQQAANGSPTDQPITVTAQPAPDNRDAAAGTTLPAVSGTPIAESDEQPQPNREASASATASTRDAPPRAAERGAAAGQQPAEQPPAVDPPAERVAAAGSVAPPTKTPEPSGNTQQAVAKSEPPRAGDRENAAEPTTAEPKTNRPSGLGLPGVGIPLPQGLMPGGIAANRPPTGNRQPTEESSNRPVAPEQSSGITPKQTKPSETAAAEGTPPSSPNASGGPRTDGSAVAASKDAASPSRAAQAMKPPAANQPRSNAGPGAKPTAGQGGQGGLAKSPPPNDRALGNRTAASRQQSLIAAAPQDGKAGDPQPEGSSAGQTGRNNQSSAASRNDRQQRENAGTGDANRMASGRPPTGNGSPRTSPSGGQTSDGGQRNGMAQANRSGNPSSPSGANPTNRPPGENRMASDRSSAAERSTPRPGMASAGNRPPGNSGNPPSGARSPTASASPQAGGRGRRQGATPPEDGMTRRSTDLMQQAQSGTSNAMSVKIDKYAGSFAGQQRRKLDLALAPEIAQFATRLKRAEKLARAVRDQLNSGEPWSPRRHRDVTSAEGEVRRAQKIASSIRGRTRGTPYAFVGLQIGDISATNLNPARENLWRAYQSDATQRMASVNEGWRQVRRAVERLERLVERYEAARQEFQLADRAEQVKNMYRVFVEDSHIRLGVRPGEASKHSRKMAEFELDDEYLERLTEVLKMRQELYAELARILDDDPRLLRRFMDNFRDQAGSIVKQMEELRRRQEKLASHTSAWSTNRGAVRDKVLVTLRKLRLDESRGLAEAAGTLSERFEAWLPFEAASDQADPAAEARSLASAAAGHGQEIALAAEKEDTELAIAEAEALYQTLREFEVAARRLGGGLQIDGIEDFAVRRILESRRLVTDLTSWLRRIREIEQGAFHRAAAIEQYQLASETDLIAAKLGGIEQQFAQTLQTPDGQLPSDLADVARRLLATLDEKATPNQLGAAIALQQPDWPRVATRQDAAVAAMAEAERLLNELIAAAIEELDKLPVQDPIASLLDDPTLDEILARLQSERDLAEELGVPRRPTNLQQIQDWLSPNRMIGQGQGGGNRAQLAARIRREMEQMNRLTDRMRQEALERVRKQTAKASKTRGKKPAGALAKRSAKSTDWNQVLSQLDAGLLQGGDKLPPREYRSAIKQYYEIVNRRATEAAEEQP